MDSPPFNKKKNFTLKEKSEPRERATLMTAAVFATPNGGALAAWLQFGLRWVPLAEQIFKGGPFFIYCMA